MYFSTVILKETVALFLAFFTHFHYKGGLTFALVGKPPSFPGKGNGGETEFFHPDGDFSREWSGEKGPCPGGRPPCLDGQPLDGGRGFFPGDCCPGVEGEGAFEGGAFRWPPGPSPRIWWKAVPRRGNPMGPFRWGTAPASLPKVPHSGPGTRGFSGAGQAFGGVFLLPEACSALGKGPGTGRERSGRRLSGPGTQAG